MLIFSSPHHFFSSSDYPSFFFFLLLPYVFPEYLGCENDTSLNSV